MAKDGKIKFEIVEELAELGGGKMLRKISWNGREPTFDLRKWYEGDDGEEKPGKGISFNDSDARDIVAALEDALAD